MILKLTNNKNTYSFEVEDLNNGEKLFYHFQIPTANMEDGNYKMVLLDGDEIITEEQVCIGAFNPQAIQYSRGENVYINAPFEANLEDVKEVEITAIETTVLPSEGYDGIKAVEVNAQPIYDEGYNVGNAEGIEVGKAEQKALLEPITITENGTYENENGYSTIEVNVSDINGSYDEGYTDGYAEGEAKGVENAGSIIAETARVLDITENGLYVSRYSEIPTPDVITGVYPDGTVFSNYAQLTNKVFNTGIKLSENTKIEIWYKPRDLGFINFGGIIGTNYDNTSAAFGLYTRIDKGFTGKIGGIDYSYKPNDLNKWFHIELSFAEGFVIDGVNYGTYSKNTNNFERYIFINDYDTKGDGYFGMIKIDDTIIIPTADGFLNTNTGELLEVAEEGDYVFTDNTPIVPEGNLIKTVNVNVVPKIDVAKTYITFGYSSFATIPEWADFTNVTNMENMFTYCSKLTTIPELYTSNVTNMGNMFSNCYSLTSIPMLDTSNVTNMRSMFANCSSLTSIPQLDTSNVTDMISFLSGTNIRTIPELNTRKVNSMNQFFYSFGGNKNLVSLPKIYCDNCNGMSQYFSYYDDGMSSLTEVGGWINLKCNWDDRYGLASCPNLTYQSCINILNGLADVTELGSRTLKVHPNFLTNVGDEISIGTNKGWIITA